MQNNRHAYECGLCKCVMPMKMYLDEGHRCDPYEVERQYNLAKELREFDEKKERQMEDKNKELMTKDVAPTMVGTLAETETRYKQLQEFIQKQMVEDEDYGTIPGCPKPSLFKSGAEKLLELYGYAVSDIQITKQENWETGFFAYEIKAIATSKRSGQIIGTGIGACNSKEKKYVSQDPYTIQNTLLKMAKKRAVVDLALLVTRSSALFTQDVEDIGISNGDKPKVADDDKKLQSDIANWCLEMSGTSKDKAKSLLLTLTRFKGKDGTEVSGVDNPNKLTGKRLLVVHSIVRKEYESYLTDMGVVPEGENA